MKKITAILFLFILISFKVVADENETFVGSYFCTAKGEKLRRQNEGRLPVDAQITFYLFKDKTNEKSYLLRNFVGYIKAAFSKKDLNTDDAYFGVFEYDNLKNDPNYKARTYIGCVHFEDFDANRTNGTDAGGMWGDLIINPNAPYDVHYYFKAGEIMGGTVDFKCKLQN